MNKNIKAFTLVELIVVITILAILGTIGFISLQGFSSDSRDSKRISELSEIRSGLQIYQARNSLLPLPSEQRLLIGSGSTTLIIQGYAGESVLNEIRMSGNSKDPVDNDYYIYSTNGNQTKFQLLSLLENSNNSNAFNNLQIIPTANADYANRFVYTVGQDVGTLLNETINAPLNKTQSGILDLSTDTTNYKIVFLDTSNIETLGGDDLYNEIVTKTQNTGIAQNTEPTPEPEPTITCPEGFILVPGNSTFSTTDFCVAKYEMKWDGTGTISDFENMYCGLVSVYSDNSCLNGNPGIISKSESLPLRRINQTDAIKLCNDMGTGYHLITNNEWMTIARNIELYPLNWADGNIGSLVSSSGGLYRGNVNLDDSVSCGTNGVLDGITDGINCLVNEGEENERNKRMHILSNGQVIWDISGNVREHVNGTNDIFSINGAVSTGNSCGSSDWFSWSGNDGYDQCIFQNGYLRLTHGPSENYNANNGVGRISSSTSTDRIFIRGGKWNDTTHVGVFELDLYNDYTHSGNALGFRCSFSVN